MNATDFALATLKELAQSDTSTRSLRQSEEEQAARTRCLPSYSFKWFQGSAAHSVAFFEEVTPTIVCADAHVPAVMLHE